MRMITIDEIDVCMRAWMHIAGVPESTFYRYQKYALKDGWEASDHGKTGLLKPREHTEQATVTLKSIVEREADHMLHCTRMLKFGERLSP